ncbi:hypothetical protein L198_00687 [Cryptococcus wingfieldii CBS 7118]|uniref:Uncharacterized protein n=1 Tax=Cryptococcus wingfieldii CBS 7118 TaxID=1295528 RepID=A0A1E3K6X4_9TREE|nr:hypothetical protein L198_00687 [Cryptococcus wingfieldii CBS 7118]ODO08948.1 hypothetical protein L198_00687 [Cryptococcus wingfieldii CBS 7118]
MPSPSPPTTLHSIPLPPLTKFLQTLSSPESLARLLSILSQHRTPDSWDRFDERLLGSGEILGNFEGDVDEKTMQDMCGPPELVQGNGGEQAGNEGLAEPPTRVLQEVKVDLRTLAPSAIFALESWRRESLGMETLVLESREYNPSAEIGESSQGQHAGERDGSGEDVYGTALAVLQERDFRVEVGEQSMGEQLSPDTSVAMDLVDDDEEQDMDMDIDDEEETGRPLACQISPTSPSPAVQAPLVEPPILPTPVNRPSQSQIQPPPESSQMVEQALPGLGLGIVPYASSAASAHGDDEDEGSDSGEPLEERAVDTLTQLASPAFGDDSPQSPIQPPPQPLPEPALSPVPSLAAPLSAPPAEPPRLPEEGVWLTDEEAEAEMLDMVDYEPAGDVDVTVDVRKELVRETEVEIQPSVEEPLGEAQPSTTDNVPRETTSLPEDQPASVGPPEESEVAPVDLEVSTTPEVIPNDAALLVSAEVEESANERTDIEAPAEPPADTAQEAASPEVQQPQLALSAPQARLSSYLSPPESSGKIVWSGVFPPQSAEPEAAVEASKRRESTEGTPDVEPSVTKAHTGPTSTAEKVTSEVTTVKETVVETIVHREVVEKPRRIEAASEASLLPQRQQTPEGDPVLASQAIPTIPASSQVYASPVRGEGQIPAPSPPKEATDEEASAGEDAGDDIDVGQQSQLPADVESQEQPSIEIQVGHPGLEASSAAAALQPDNDTVRTEEDITNGITKGSTALPESDHGVALEAATEAIEGPARDNGSRADGAELGQSAQASETDLAGEPSQPTASASQSTVRGEASNPITSPSAPRRRSRKSDNIPPFLLTRCAQATTDEEEHVMNDVPLDGESALKEAERDVRGDLDEEEMEGAPERPRETSQNDSDVLAQESGLPAASIVSSTATRQSSTASSAPPTPSPKQKDPPPRHLDAQVAAPLTPTPQASRSASPNNLSSPPLQRKSLVVNTYKTFGKRKSSDSLLGMKDGKSATAGASRLQSKPNAKPPIAKKSVEKEKEEAPAEPVVKRKRGRPSTAKSAQSRSAVPTEETSAALSTRPVKKARGSSSKAVPRRQFKKFEIVVPSFCRGSAKRRKDGEHVSPPHDGAAPEVGSSLAGSSHLEQVSQPESRSPQSDSRLAQPSSSHQPSPTTAAQAPRPQKKRPRVSRGDVVVDIPTVKRARRSLKGKERAAPEVEDSRADLVDDPTTPTRKHPALQAAQLSASKRSFSVIEEAMERLNNPLRDLESVSLQNGHFSPVPARAAGGSKQGEPVSTEHGRDKETVDFPDTLWSENGSTDGHENIALASPQEQPPLPSSPILASQSSIPVPAPVPARKELISAPFRSRANPVSRPRPRQQNPLQPSASASHAPAPVPGPVLVPVPVVVPVPELVALPSQPIRTTSASTQSAPRGGPDLRAPDVDVKSGDVEDGSAGPAADTGTVTSTNQAGKIPRRKGVVFEGVVLPMRSRTRKSLNKKRGESSLRVEKGAGSKKVPRKSV